ncbi:3-hydroxyacyl-CoA dehydrogenase family protein [Amycolatopsis sp. Hca4]|uniref:3-hydroxyacyl-CoA dehydrogenase family protein n=1 Tax=unclassified Amycolatopsis TaxID=2618356 RepID=UPI0015915C01|nr:3-hydroxyacyl-CoA dehydrogenase family protein [Amycolatopsis sp. Hca4]QKV80603.1 3-hydroxyacyl-CoA dehydrogenase family protein [Amycolatopsis sp. Hca4]
MSGERLAVLGAGVMGTAITTLAAGHGLPVTVVDVDPARLAAVEADVRGQLRLAQLMGKLPGDVTAGEITPADNVAAVAEADVVIESITERPELKAKVLAEVSAVVRPGALLVSNTSAIPIDELAGSVTHPGRLVGIHFMNPPYLIHAVELIRGPRSTDAAMAAAAALLDRLGRAPVVVGDGPGFVINRILQRTINEAARIVEEGIASPEAVDAAFTGCLGHTTGPLATADLIGLDNVVDSLRVLHERTGDAGYEPCALLLRKVADGDFGRKTGQGFHRH